MWKGQKDLEPLGRLHEFNPFMPGDLNVWTYDTFEYNFQSDHEFTEKSKEICGLGSVLTNIPPLNIFWIIP